MSDLLFFFSWSRKKMMSETVSGRKRKQLKIIIIFFLIWCKWQCKPFIDFQFYSCGVLSGLIHHFLNTRKHNIHHVKINAASQSHAKLLLAFGHYKYQAVRTQITANLHRILPFWSRHQSSDEEDKWSCGASENKDYHQGGYSQKEFADGRKKKCLHRARNRKRERGRRSEFIVVLKWQHGRWQSIAFDK